MKDIKNIQPISMTWKICTCNQYNFSTKKDKHLICLSFYLSIYLSSIARDGVVKWWNCCITLVLKLTEKLRKVRMNEKVLKPNKELGLIPRGVFTGMIFGNRHKLFCKFNSGTKFFSVLKSKVNSSLHDISSSLFRGFRISKLCSGTNLVWSEILLCQGYTSKISFKKLFDAFTLIISLVG